MLNYIDHCWILFCIEFPSVPERYRQFFSNFELLRSPRFAHHQTWHSKIKEWISMKINRKPFENFKKLNCLKCSYCRCCCCQCRNNFTSFDFDSDPVHRSQGVIWSSNICHWVNEVNVEVRIIIFLKLFYYKLRINFKFLLIHYTFFNRLNIFLNVFNIIITILLFN